MSLSREIEKGEYVWVEQGTCEGVVLVRVPLLPTLSMNNESATGAPPQLVVSTVQRPASSRRSIRWKPDGAFY